MGYVSRLRQLEELVRLLEIRVLDLEMKKKATLEDFDTPNGEKAPQGQGVKE